MTIEMPIKAPSSCHSAIIRAFSSLLEVPDAAAGKCLVHTAGTPGLVPFALIGTVVFSASEHQNGLARLVSVSDDNNDLPWVLALL
jgi:hypothetical protein